MIHLKKIVHHPLAIVLSRFVLGGIFIYASFGKIQDPQAFADILYNYKLLPDFFINFLAVYLPWLEMLAGLCLVAGIFSRTSAIILSSMLVVFIVALTINALRGLDFNCGCFSPGSEGSSDPFALIVRDLLMLIPGFIIIFFVKEPKLKFKNK
jgi:uncharacterized membrane protein YphA (DoxX/SURF4 family)